MLFRSELKDRKERKKRIRLMNATSLRDALETSHSNNVVEDEGVRVRETQKLPSSPTAHGTQSIRRTQAGNKEKRKQSTGRAIARELEELIGDREKVKECFGRIRIMIAVAKRRLEAEKTGEKVGEKHDDLKEGLDAVEKVVMFVIDAGGDAKILRKIRIPKMFEGHYVKTIRESGISY